MHKSSQGTEIDRTSTKTEDSRFLSRSPQLPFPGKAGQHLDRVLKHNNLFAAILLVPSSHLLPGKLPHQGKLPLQGRQHLCARQLQLVDQHQLLDSLHPNLPSSRRLSCPHHLLSQRLAFLKTPAPPLSTLPEAEEARVEVDQVVDLVQHRKLVVLHQLCLADHRQHRQDVPQAPTGSPTSQLVEEVEAYQANQPLPDLLHASLLPGYRSDQPPPCHRPLSRTLPTSSSSREATPSSPASSPDRPRLLQDRLSPSRTHLPPLSPPPPSRSLTSTSCWGFSRARVAALANGSPHQVAASPLKQPCPKETLRDSLSSSLRTSQQEFIRFGYTDPILTLALVIYFMPQKI